MKSTMKHLLITVLTGSALVFGAAGCKEKSESEKAADALKDAVDKTAKAAEKSAEAVKDAAKDVKKEAEKATK